MYALKIISNVKRNYRRETGATDHVGKRYPPKILAVTDKLVLKIFIQDCAVIVPTIL